jgi:hypothetical protein
MKVVEIRCEPKTFNRSLNIGLDVLGGVGDSHAIFEY